MSTDHVPSDRRPIRSAPELSQSHPWPRHRVVAHPIPEAPHLDSPTQPPTPTTAAAAPALYDTSVSSATLTNSAEDGRSTGSSGGHYHPYRLGNRSRQPQPHPPSYQFSESPVTRHPDDATTPRFSPRSDHRYNNSNNNNNSRSTISSHADLDLTDPSFVTQSEPGVSVEHDRFSAYINRFAELDPRMDHRHSVEEKKMDDHRQHMEPSDRYQQKNRFRARSGYHPQPQPQPQRVSAAVTTSHSQEEAPPSSRRGHIHRTEETMSDIVVESPSNRTRDLARRIEQHMGKKQLFQQQQQQQIRESMNTDDGDCDIPPSPRVSFDESTPDNRQQQQQNTKNPALHFNNPQLPHQLGATYIPIPKPTTHYAEETTDHNRPSSHRVTHRAMPAGRSKPISTSRPMHDPQRRVSPPKVASPNDVVSRRIDVSKAPTYPERPNTDDINDGTAPPYQSVRSKPAARQPPPPQQQRQLASETSSRRDRTTTSIYDERRNGQAPPPPPNGDLSPPTTTSSTLQRPEPPRQPRSRSLGPPERRRRRQYPPSPHESTPTQQYATPNEFVIQNEVEDPNNLEGGSAHHKPLIRRLGHRAEIETPLPANVRELRKMLWTEDELLQVKVRSSYRDVENRDANYYGQLTHIGGPEMAGTAGQRNSRSLSPKTHRMRNMNHDTDPRPLGVSSGREQKGMLFKSRYYEAALRGEMSTSPKRGIAMAADEPNRSHGAMIPPTHVLESVSPVKQQKSNSSSSDVPSGSNEDIDTALAIQPVATNDSSTRQATNMRSMEHRKKLEATDASKKEDFAAYLLQRINQVSKDDPQAALAEINALLRQQPTNSETRPETTNKQRVDDPGTREIASVPGVEQARPMAGDTESDDESDGTSVSSMTNPTFQDVGNKSSVPISPSSGRPRPSLLGSYNNPSQVSLSTNRLGGAETRSHNIVKDDQKIAAVSDKRNVVKTTGNCDTGTPKNEDNDAANRKASNFVSANGKPQLTEKPPTTSFLSQIGSLISPRKIEDPPVLSKEISEKIKQWDELSTGAIPVQSASESNARDAPLSAKSESKVSSKLSNRRDLSPGTSSSTLQREHPWDAAIPVRMGQINTKDTSMDCGDGIEAEFTPKYSKTQNKVTNISATPRTLRKQHDTPEHQPTANKVVEQKKEAPQFISNQHQQTKAMSDDFDSAWVSLPLSTFFGSKENAGKSNRNNGVTGHERSNMPAKSQREVVRQGLQTVSADDDVEVEYVQNSTRIRSSDVQSIVPEESKHSYAQLKSPKKDVYPRHRKSSTFDDSYEQSPRHSVLNTNKSFETAPATGDERKPRSRGLIGFLKRKQAEKIQTGGTGGSIDRTSASVASRRSAATTTTTTRPLGDLADIETSPSNGNYSELVNRYTRRSAKSRSPSRNRSRSVDERKTTRTPSLARKFNRLLRVYDHDVNEV